MKYFISFELVTEYGKSLYNCVTEENYKLDSEENIDKMEFYLRNLKCGGPPRGIVTILFFKELYNE